jgi:predicted amidohydrolase
MSQQRRAVIGDPESDEFAALQQARRAARAAARAAADIAAFAEQFALPLEPNELAEFAALLGREEEARGQRQDAFELLGLRVPSLEEEAQ